MKISAPSSTPADDKPSVFQKVFAVLECVAGAERPLTVSDLAVLLDVPKGTMHRIVHQLETDGLLMAEVGARGYVPSSRLFDFALTVAHAGMRSTSRHTILQRVSSLTGETCNFGMISAGELVYVDRVEASWPFGLHYKVGSRVPMHCTSMGKLLLAHMPKRRREHLLSVSPLHRYTPQTKTDPEELSEEFKEIRERGYSLDNEEFLAGVLCIAVPIRDSRGNVCAAIAVSAPHARLSMKQAIAHVPLLAEAAESIPVGKSFHDSSLNNGD